MFTGNSAHSGWNYWLSGKRSYPIQREAPVSWKLFYAWTKFSWKIEDLNFDMRLALLLLMVSCVAFVQWGSRHGCSIHRYCQLDNVFELDGRKWLETLVCRRADCGVRDWLLIIDTRIPYSSAQALLVLRVLGWYLYADTQRSTRNMGFVWLTQLSRRVGRLLWTILPSRLRTRADDM